MAETWDEGRPKGTDNPKDGDDEIRNFKTAIRERLAVDHHFQAEESPVFGTVNSTIGYHKRVTLMDRALPPVTKDNQLVLYASKVGGRSELYVRKESSGEIVQLTATGGVLAQDGVIFQRTLSLPVTGDGQIALYCGLDEDGNLDLFVRDQNNGSVASLTDSVSAIPKNEIILFESDVAVLGYRLMTDVGDALLYVSRGSAVGGSVEEGGTWRQGGTWTMPNHAHNAGGLYVPPHGHQIYRHFDSQNTPDYIFDENGAPVPIPGTQKTAGAQQFSGISRIQINPGQTHNVLPNTYTTQSPGRDTNQPIGGTTQTYSPGSSWRPKGWNFTRQKKI